MKTITIKNFQLDSMFKVMNYPMNFQRGRVKNKFLGILRDKHQVVNNSRLEILNDLSEKDEEKKTPILENGQYKLSDENRLKFNDEYTKLMNEECVIDVLPSWEKDVPHIKMIINDSPIDLTDQEISDVDAVLEAMSDKKPEEKKEAKKKAPK